MKKIICNIVLALSIITVWIFSIQITHANQSWEKKENENVVIVTEKVPGGNCVFMEERWLYRCTIKSGFTSIMQVMGQLLKYFTFLAGLFAVLGLVVGWIMYSMWWADENLKTKSKEFIIKSLLWLILLLISWLILYAVAPWVYK